MRESRPNPLWGEVRKKEKEMAPKELTTHWFL